MSSDVGCLTPLSWTGLRILRFLTPLDWTRSSDLQNLTFHLLTCRLMQMEIKALHFGGNRARWEQGAAFEGNTLKGKSHECQWHEIRPQGSLRSKPPRGWENLKVEHSGYGNPAISGLKLLRAVGKPNLMRVVSFWGQDMISQALEVIERPWMVDCFGGHRVVDEFLRDPVFIFNWLTPKGHRGWT